MNKLDGRIIQLKFRLASDRQADEVVKEMAELFGITTLYLNQIFKKQIGKTIFQYDRDKRLENAKIILETTYKSVKEIYAQVGFNEYTNFIREFKKQYGISPKAFQKQSWITHANKETGLNLHQSK